MKNRKKLFRKTIVMMITIFMMSLMTVPAMASDVDGGVVVENTTVETPQDPVKVIDNTNNLIFGIVRGLGIMGCIFGLVSLATSFNNHDTGQRIMGGSALVSGLLMVFAKQILILIGAY